MYPFRRRRNCNGCEDTGKCNGLVDCVGRPKLFRNDQGEPTLECDYKFNYNQKHPTIYQEKKVGTTLAEKEKVLRTSMKNNDELSTTSNIKKSSSMYVNDVAINNSLSQNLCYMGPKRSLTSDRSTSLTK